MKVMKNSKKFLRDIVSDFTLCFFAVVFCLASLNCAIWFACDGDWFGVCATCGLSLFCGGLSFWLFKSGKKKLGQYRKIRQWLLDVDATPAETQETERSSRGLIEPLQSNEAALNRINDSGKFYVLSFQWNNKQLPSVFGYGIIFVLTNADDIRKVQAHFTSPLILQEFSAAQFPEYMAYLRKYGVAGLNIDCFTDKAPIHMSLPAYFGNDSKVLENSTGQVLLRYLELNANGTLSGYKAYAISLWSLLCHHLPNDLYLAPFAYENESPDIPVNETVLHVIPGTVYKEGMPTFLGADDYRMEADEGSRPVHILTINNGEHIYIPVFFDVPTLHRVFGKNVRIGVFRFETLCSFGFDRVNETPNGEINGVVMDPTGLDFILDREDIEFLRKESAGQLHIPHDTDIGCQLRFWEIENDNGTLISKGKKRTETYNQEVSQSIPMEEPIQKEDVSPIVEQIHATPVNSVWMQYDILYPFAYGWDNMIRSADHIIATEFTQTDIVTHGFTSMEAIDITDKFVRNGSKCEGIPELEEEASNIGVCGFSRSIQLPVKLIWFNQTRFVRMMVPTHDEEIVRRCGETFIRQSFGV